MVGIGNVLDTEVAANTWSSGGKNQQPGEDLNCRAATRGHKMSQEVKASIAENGHAHTVVAKTYHELPRAGGQHSAKGTFNGRPHLFVLTHGMGRGTVDRHYAYVEHEGRIWYIDTGDGFLSEGASIHLPV